MPKVNIRQVISKDRCVAFYVAKEDGEVARAPITPKQYASLAGPKPRQLKPDEPHEPLPRSDLPKGKTWVFQYAIGGVPVFDTPDGELQSGDFCANVNDGLDVATLPIYCKPDGKYSVPEEYNLIGDELTITKEKNVSSSR